MLRPARPLILLLALALAGAARAPEAETSWYLVASSDGAQIGWSSTEVRESPDGREIRGTQRIEVAGPQGPMLAITESSVRREDKAGNLLSIVQDSATGRNRTRTEARIHGNRAEMSRTSKHRRETASIALPSGTRFDGGTGLLADWDPAAVPRLEFDSLSLDAMAIEQVVIEPLSGAAAPPGRMIAVRRRYEGGELRAVARIELDAQRRILQVTLPMFGTQVTTRRTTREAALRPFHAYRLLDKAMFKAPFRIPEIATAGHIRYRFGFRDGIAFTPPQTGEQRVATDADGITIDICKDCGPAPASDPATIAAALRPTHWLQSDSRRIHRIVASVAASDAPGAARMELLAARVRGYIEKVDFAGHYTALDALTRRSGDCTEAAVLLAAFGRAAGIPTRVVNGLVYSRERYHGVGNVFMPHSWVLAWVDGRWRSFDAALLEFDTTHIALSVGDGDARSLATASQLASLLVWQSMVEVRTR